MACLDTYVHTLLVFTNLLLPCVHTVCYIDLDGYDYPDVAEVTANLSGVYHPFYTICLLWVIWARKFVQCVVVTELWPNRAVDSWFVVTAECNMKTTGSGLNSSPVPTSLTLNKDTTHTGMWVYDLEQVHVCCLSSFARQWLCDLLDFDTYDVPDEVRSADESAKPGSAHPCEYTIYFSCLFVYVVCMLLEVLITCTFLSEFSCVHAPYTHSRVLVPLVLNLHYHYLASHVINIYEQYSVA